MKLRHLGIVQIILAIIIIFSELEKHNILRSMSKTGFLAFLNFNPEYLLMNLIAVLMIVIGIQFIKSREEINFHLEAAVSNVGIKLPPRSVGVISLMLGLVVLAIPIYKAGLFSSFSLGRVGALFFDDAKIPFTALAFLLIILGSYILAKNKNT